MEGGTILGLVQLPKYFYVLLCKVRKSKRMNETKSSCVYNSNKTLILKIISSLLLKITHYCINIVLYTQMFLTNIQLKIIKRLKYHYFTLHVT